MDIYCSPCSYRTNFQIISDDSLVEDFPKYSSCSLCKRCLAGEETVQRENANYCWKCFEKVFGLKCTACLKLITGLSKMSFVYFKNQAWHKQCFYCSNCGILPEGGEFEQISKFSYCKSCNEKRKFHLG